MKKRLVVCLFVIVMAFSFVIPAMANETTVKEPVYGTNEQEISPRTEQTQIYWRNYQGRLQFRVWGLTSGRWLTEWTDLA